MRRLSLLYGDAARLARGQDLDGVLEAFGADLRLHVAEFARRMVFVHAGVVGWRGRAVLIPGRSFAGKTTLVAELVRAGARYYSDEYAVIDRAGMVHPFAKPLGVRDDEGVQSDVTPRELGGRAGRRPIPAGLVALCEFRAGARWRPRRLSGGRGVLALLAHTISARRDPRAAVEVLGRAVSGVPVYKGLRGEAAATAAAIIDAMEREYGTAARGRVGMKAEEFE